MHTENPEKSFSHLNIPVLKDEARSWVEGFSDEPIRRIILYRYSRPAKGRSKPLGNIKAIYAIVFEVDADDKRVNMNSEEGSRFLEEKLKNERALFPGEKLLDATGQYQTVGDENQRAHFLTADFECIYKTPPSSDFREKWVFRVKYNNTQLDPNIRVEKQKVLLYQAIEEKESSLPSNHKAGYYRPLLPRINYQGRHSNPDMTNLQENNPMNFPDLRLEQLQLYAQRWVEKFPQAHIEKVLLYHASNDYFKDVSVKYMVMFEVSGYPHSELKSINREFVNFIWNQNHGGGTFNPSAHVERLEFSLHGGRTPFDDLLTAVDHDKRTFIDAGFDVVYNFKPGTMDDRLSEWSFKIKTSEIGIGKSIKTDEPFWTLYPTELYSDFSNKETYLEDPKKSSHKVGMQKGSENYFIRNGDYWEVGFAGETSTIDDSMGLRTVVALLKNPNHEFNPSDLYQAVVSGNHPSLYDEETTQHYNRMSKTHTKENISKLEKEENLKTENSPTKKFSEQQKKRLKQDVKQAYEAFKEGELSNDEWAIVANHAEQKYGLMIKIGKNGLSLSFRPRLIEENEKARIRNYKNIDKFKRKIKKNIPKLYKHLHYNISPAAFKISYPKKDSENSVPWIIKD